MNSPRLPLASLAAAVLVAALPATAHAFDPTKDRETHLLSRALDGGFPNGPSRNAVFAQNGQGASFVAFESDASNIVAGDTNGVTDVFVVRRGGSFTQKNGEPWQPAGPAQLVSTGLGGAPANGPSYDPQADGDAKHRAPHCVAFVSQASNLVPNDTNGKADAFVKDLRSGVITRVSVGTGGVQSDGDTFDVSIDGSCTRVAFTSNASNLYLAKGKGATKFLKTQPPAPGSKQVYVRLLTGTKDNRKLKGVTFLASASKRGVPGAGESYDVSFGRLGDGCPKRCGTSAGDSIAFTSTAANLAGRDSNGVADVYQRTFYRSAKRFKRKQGVIRPRTLLISATRNGVAGNGPSTNAASNDDGEFVVFETDATDLVSGDRNNASDVLMRGTFKGSPYMRMVSHARETGQANAASHDPTITSPASIVFFSSDATNLQPNKPRADKYYDRNCMTDVFFWNTVSGNASLQSRDSLQRIPNLPENVGASTEAACPPVVAKGSTNPAASYYGNYFVFESSYPLLDLSFETYVQNVIEGAIANPLAKWEAAAKASHDDPSLLQIYLRYNGPAKADAKFPPSSWPKPAS